MKEQDKVFQQMERVEDFTFDERVAKVFDDMVSRSVPFYNEIQRIQSDLVMNFLPEQGGVICDLGCSTGTTIEVLSQHPLCPKSTRFIGYDNAESMLAKAHEKLSEQIATGRVSLIAADINRLPQLPTCDVVIVN